MAGESFFVPSTAWLAKRVDRLDPSFLPGEAIPAWIGPREVKDLAITAEPVLVLLYLAGYEVPEIAIGFGESPTAWVSFSPEDLRIRLGSGPWSAHVGSVHPGAGTQLLAVHATPMAHQQLPVDSAHPVWGVPIPIPMTAGGFTVGDVATQPATLTADAAGWIVLNASPLVREASVLGVRDQVFPHVIAALTTFQAAQSVTEPPGLTGMYDPVNWRPVRSTSAADPASDRVETLRRVALRLTGARSQTGGGAPPTTGGWLENDDDPATHPTLTAARASDFLDLEIPHPQRVLTGHALGSGWSPLRDRVDALHRTVEEQSAAVGELKDLERHGAHPDLQSLTATILDLHDRGLVDVLAGYAGTATTDDPCGEALRLARDLATPLTAEAVVTMCDCLDRGVTSLSHVVAQRLVDDYPSMYADAESRARIRSTLIGACAVAESHNPALNASSVAAVADTESAEHFAGLLAATLTSEPDPDANGFDVEQYVNPLLEVADAWDRWSPLLTGPAASAKLISVTCDVFVDCGHPKVSRLAAERVIDHYQQGLTDLEQQSGEHWADPAYGQEFQGWGSERPALAGWREQTLVSMLAMLANTHEGSELADLHDTLSWLVGPDPLQGFDIEAFEEAYSTLLGKSKDPLVGEYTLLLELVSGYAAASETEAARFNPVALELRFDAVVADPALMGRLEALRDRAFSAAQDRWRSRQELQREIEAFATSPRHQLLLVCLDAERRLAYQDELVARVRRVCPQANQAVLGAFLGAGFATDAHLLVAEIGEDDLVVMLDEIAAVYEFPASKFTRQLAKTLKDGPLGIPKAFLTESVKKDVKEAKEAGAAIVAARRARLGPEPLTSAAAKATYLARIARAEELVKVLEEVHQEKLDVPNNLGHVASIFVAGVVCYQFAFGDPPDLHIGNVDVLTSAGRDVFVGAAAVAQIGAASVKFLAERPAEWAGLVDRIAAVGSLLTKISSVVTLFSNLGATARAYVAGDWWGVVLNGAATAAAAVAVFATLSGAAAPVGAIAAAAATVLVLVDILRKYAIAHGERGDLYEATVVEPRLLFARRVAIVAPDPGEFGRTVAYGAGDEVTEIGFVEWPKDGGESRGVEGTVANWAIGDGITAMYAAATETDDGFGVWAPLPAVAAEAVDQGGEDASVFLDDVLLTVIPRFESWVEVAAADFDAVLVRRGDPVSAGETVAVWAGESFAADHDGIVGAIESGTDPGYLNARIRIWAVGP